MAETESTQTTTTPYIEATTTGRIAGGRTASTRITQFLLTLFYTLLSLLFLIPFYWMVISSIRPPERIFADAGKFYPTAATLVNYISLFTNTPFITWFLNSVIITFGFAFLALAVCTLGGYAMAFYRFKGRNLLFLIILASQMVPFYLMLVPLFLTMVRTGLIDRYLGVIIPMAASPFGLFYMRQYMSSISKELLEAARIDGANDYRIFWSIVLPLTKPGLGAMLILFSLDMWNNLIWPIIVLRSADKLPLAVGLASLLNSYRPRYDVLMSGAMLATLPIVILFLFFQKQFILGMTATGMVVEK